jgi:DNA-binding transcriptional LysR family regulator
MDIMPELIVRFRVKHPQITVDLLLTDTALELAANRVHLALRASVGSLPETGYRASLLTDWKIGFYAAPGYLAHSREP